MDKPWMSIKGFLDWIFKQHGSLVPGYRFVDAAQVYFSRTQPRGSTQRINPYIKGGSMIPMQDDRDFMATLPVMETVDLHLSDYPLMDIEELRLRFFGRCRCSDDLSYVCLAHTRYAYCLVASQDDDKPVDPHRLDAPDS